MKKLKKKILGRTTDETTNFTLDVGFGLIEYSVLRKVIFDSFIVLDLSPRAVKFKVVDYAAGVLSSPGSTTHTLHTVLNQKYFFKPLQVEMMSNQGFPRRSNSLGDDAQSVMTSTISPFQLIFTIVEPKNIVLIVIEAAQKSFD